MFCWLGVKMYCEVSRGKSWLRRSMIGLRSTAMGKVDNMLRLKVLFNIPVDLLFLRVDFNVKLKRISSFNQFKQRIAQLYVDKCFERQVNGRLLHFNICKRIQKIYRSETFGIFVLPLTLITHGIL